MKDKLKKLTAANLLIFSIFTLWWLLLHFNKAPSGLNGNVFSDTYGVTALIGGVVGIFIARKWGGFKSALGKSLMFLSLGLLAQAFGQFVYSIYYFFLNQSIPYPSIGDIGYFGSVLLYIYAIYCLAKVSGAHISLKSYQGKFFAVVIPAVMLAISYYVFLRGYSYSNFLTAVLDFGYPLGEAVYISIAILTFTLSRSILGGIMKKRILLLIFALAVQYAADFLFLYQDSRNQWSAGGISDFLYLLAYFVMTMALLSMGYAYLKIKEA